MRAGKEKICIRLRATQGVVYMDYIIVKKSNIKKDVCKAGIAVLALCAISYISYVVAKGLSYIDDENEYDGE